MTAYDLHAKRIEVAQSAKARRCDPYDESILGICGVLALVAGSCKLDSMAV